MGVPQHRQTHPEVLASSLSLKPQPQAPEEQAKPGRHSQKDPQSPSTQPWDNTAAWLHITAAWLYITAAWLQIQGKHSSSDNCQKTGLESIRNTGRKPITHLVGLCSGGSQGIRHKRLEHDSCRSSCAWGNSCCGFMCSHSDHASLRLQQAERGLHMPRHHGACELVCHCAHVHTHTHIHAGLDALRPHTLFPAYVWSLDCASGISACTPRDQ